MSRSIQERVCRTLEGVTALEWYSNQESLSGLVYRFCHVANANRTCLHDDWMTELERVEAEIEEAYYTSPEARRKREAREP